MNCAVLTSLTIPRWGIPFMMQAWRLFCICSLIYVLVSLVTPAPAAESVDGLTWNHPLSAVTQEPFRGRRDARLIAMLLAVAVAALYYVFR